MTETIGPPRLLVRSSIPFPYGRIHLIVLKSFECLRNWGFIWFDQIEYHWEAFEFLELLFFVDCSSFSDLSKMITELSYHPAIKSFKSFENDALLSFIS